MATGTDWRSTAPERWLQRLTTNHSLSPAVQSWLEQSLNVIGSTLTVAQGSAKSPEMS